MPPCATVDNFKRMLDIVKSPSNGITMYQGNFSLMGADIPTIVKDFGKRGVIHFVHFRNVRGGKFRFEETFHDEGQIDMYAAMKAYYDIGFKGPIRPDHELIMFGMGTSMGLGDFVGVIRTPRGVLIGVVSHFIIMPMIGYSLASISGLPSEIAAGIILIGCSPNGIASNVISYLAKANLALSITITAVSTLLTPFITPFLMKFLAVHLCRSIR